MQYAAFTESCPILNMLAISALAVEGAGTQELADHLSTGDPYLTVAALMAAERELSQFTGAQLALIVTEYHLPTASAGTVDTLAALGVLGGD